MTKTPKLENAVRIVDEWTDLDNEARAVPVLSERLKTINPIHELVASTVSENWLDLHAFLQTIQLPETSDVASDDNQEGNDNTWFAELIGDII